MGKKLLLSLSLILLLALSLSTALNMNPASVSAVEYPAVMVVPERNLVDSSLTPGTSFTVSIYTDYEEADVWGWQFTLSFNPLVLHGGEVTNGELITTEKDPSATFVAGEFDNEAGELSLTFAYFFFTEPPAPLTSGPGTLANVTFTVVGVGTSDITLGDETQLKAPDYNIVDGVTDPYHLGHGYFDNTAPPPEKGTLSGTVKDASTGQPIAGATVSYVSGQTLFTSVTTDDSGAYSIVEELDLGDYKVKASKDGYYYLTQTITIVKGANTLDFALQPVPLTGTLSVDTTPVKGEVFVDGVSWGIAPVSKVVEVGTYTVSFGAVEGYKTPVPQTVDVVKDTETSVLGTYEEAVGGDVAVTNVVPAATQAYPTWTVPLDISVTVKNVGGVTVSFTVTAYYDETPIETLPVTDLAPTATKELTFSWDLSAVSWGLYTIKAVATLEGDVNTDNNVLIDGTVKVKMPGDVVGNAEVKGLDLTYFASAWWSVKGVDENYNLQCDFDNNGDVKGLDLTYFAAYWWDTTDAYSPDP